MNDFLSQDPRYGLYRKTGLQVMRPYEKGEDMTVISVAFGDVPEEGGMVACNPKNLEDRWYVAAKFFADNYERVDKID